MFNIIYGPDDVQKAYLYQAYRPMFQFVAHEILLPGLQQNCFRPVDIDRTATLLMTLYLGAASHTDAEGKSRLDPEQVIALVLHGINR